MQWNEEEKNEVKFLRTKKKNREGDKSFWQGRGNKNTTKQVKMGERFTCVQGAETICGR